MSEYIIEIPDEYFASYETERDVYYPDERDSAMRITPIVRCRDCKFGVDGGKYCAEGCADSWDWRNVEPDGFCSWAERRDE